MKDKFLMLGVDVTQDFTMASAHYQASWFGRLLVLSPLPSMLSLISVVLVYRAFALERL